MKQWWGQTSDDFTALQSAIDTTRTKVDTKDEAGIQDDCYKMQDASTKLAGHLPSPDADVNANITGAIADAKAAAHGCLAAIQNAYVQQGDFDSFSDVAGRQLKLAQSIVNRMLTQA